MEKTFELFLRYLILILIALPNFYLFYLIFTPLTLYPVYFLLNLFYSVALKGIVIDVSGGYVIEIIEACVAGSAYYLLVILNLSTPKIKIAKRMKMLGISFLAFLIINILRIFLLSVMFISDSYWFNLAHELFWYVGSLIFIVAIWFWEIKHYKIKEIPVFSDLKFLIKKLG